jgi:hypothetical protein
MIAAVQDLGLTSGLKLCLDAGDVNSYTGTGQKWLDTSGNGYDFFRGTTSASQSSDPTFNGTAGGQSSSEYWSFDGGDFFTYDSANETWMNNIHKNNAVFTLATWVYFATVAGGNLNVMAGTAIDGFDRGFAFFCGQNTGRLGINILNGGGSSVALQYLHSTVAAANTWHFVAVSINESTGALVFRVDGAEETASVAYSSPSSSNATRTMTLGTDGDDHFPSGGRMASVLAWEGTALTAQNLTDLFTLTRTKFGV